MIFPSVSVVINTLNRCAHLEDALRSLRNLDYPNFEVIVVNGPSTDATEAVLSAWQGNVKLERCGLPNLSMSRNVGIRAASGDIVAFIDDDAVPHPRWLTNIIPYFSDHRVGAVGGYTIDNTGVRLQAGKTICDRFGNAYYVDEWFDERALCRPGTPYYRSLLGTNSAFRRSILQDIGGFDETFAYLLDETDVCLRIIDAGYRVLYEPNALVFHQYAPSAIRDSNKVARTFYPSSTSKAYFVKRHGEPLAPKLALEELENYRAELLKCDQWYEETGLVTSEHRHSLDQDVLWGIERGIARAQERAGRVLGDLGPKLGDPSPFVPFASPDKSNSLAVCLVSYSYPPRNDAGIARWTFEVAHGLARRGHRVHVITRSDTDVESIRYEQGVWVHTCQAQNEAIRAFVEGYDIPAAHAEWCARTYREVSYIKGFGLDVVSFPIFDLECLPVLDDSQVASVVSLHTTYAMAAPFKPAWQARPLYKAFHVDRVINAERECLRRATTILANSQAIISDLEAAYGIAMQNRCVIVPHGTEDLLEGGMKADRSPGVLRVLYVGRHEERKGFDIALSATKRILDAGVRATFTFVGGVVDEASRNLANELGCGSLLNDERVRFNGVVDRRSLDSLYRDSDVVMMPSRYESFGLVAIEAMSAGTPVIVPTVGGLGEVVRNNVSGITFNLDDNPVNSIVDAVMSLANNPELLQSLSQGARDEFVRHFTIDTMIDGIEAVYRKAIARGGC